MNSNNNKNDRVGSSIDESSSSNSNNSKMKKYNYVILKIITKTKGIVMLQLIKHKSGPRNKIRKPRSAPAWFIVFQEQITQTIKDLEQRLNQKIEEVNNKVDKNHKEQKEFNNQLIKRLDNIVKLNNLKE